MTIVIGMLAGHTQNNANPLEPAQATAMLIADTLATYTLPRRSPVTSHASEAKIYPLPHNFFCGFSDDYHWSHDVATELNLRMAGIDFASDCVIDLIKLEVQHSFEYAFRWYRTKLLQDEIGITEDEFLHDKKLRKNLQKAAQEVVSNRSGEVPAELIIIGQTHRGPVLLKANAAEVRESTSFAVTGAAQDSAISWFKFRDQRSGMSVPRSFYHLVEAKRFVQTDRTVGQQSQIVILTTLGDVQRYQDDGHTTMKEWFDRFCIVDTSELDGTEAKNRFDEAGKRATNLAMPSASKASR